MTPRAFLAIGAVMALGTWSPVARAEEAKTPIKAAMMLSIIAQPAELSGRALDRALLEPGPRPPAMASGEVQPDGSVKYGNVTVTVRNPCPPGTLHYEPPPLPGRRARQQ